MGTARNDLLFVDAVAVELFDVLPGEHLEEVFVAGATRRVTGTRFLLTKDGEVDAGLLHQLGRRLSDLFGTLVERRGTSDPKQNRRVGVLGDCLDVQSVGPLGAIFGWEVPGVGR